MSPKSPFRAPQKIAHPCPELLLRVACFDAYAAAFEFVVRTDQSPKEQAEAREMVRSFGGMHPAFGYQQNPRHLEAKASCYTDDTERAIGNARALLEYSPHLTRSTFAAIYVDEFNRSGRRKGYARGFQVLLESVKTGGELLAKIRSRSCKNGAMMGAGVLGVLPTIEEVLEAAAIQASVTHNTRCGIFTARVAALATHFALYRCDPLDGLRAFLLEHGEVLWAQHDNEEDCGHTPFFRTSLTEPWVSKIVSHSETYPLGLATVQATLTRVSRMEGLTEAMSRCLEMGGDTDSVAAVLASILAPRCRAEKLPDFLERDLEFCDPWTGTPPRLLQLGGALMRKYS